MDIFKGNRESRRGPAEWFSGGVWLDAVIPGTAPTTLKVTRVTFAPGARTAWHTHPRGQGLFILSGVCQAQTRGDTLLEIHAGDGVWFAPGEVHWHGAKPGHTMVHLAMQESDDHGVDVVWMEHVTGAEIAS